MSVKLTPRNKRTGLSAGNRQTSWTGLRREIEAGVRYFWSKRGDKPTGPLGRPAKGEA